MKGSAQKHNVLVCEYNVLVCEYITTSTRRLGK